jgi:ribosomal protein S18 acetylase RimI-like enzyme
MTAQSPAIRNEDTRQQATGIQIRPLAHEDADSLRELYFRSLRLNVEGFVQNPAFHGDIWQRAETYRENGGDMLGMFDGGKLICIGGLKRKTETTADVCNLHLDAAYQGRGLGRRFVMQLLARARTLGIETAELHVTASQKAAIGLYTSLGFKVTARRTYEIEGNSYDTIFMALPLQDAAL